MTLLEMTLNAPGFKAYCRRRIVPNMTPTMTEIFEAARMERKAEFRAFCKRRGINSILKAETKRGRLSQPGVYDIGNGSTAQLKKVNGEFISIYEEPIDLKIARLLEEQNRLLTILKAA